MCKNHFAWTQLEDVEMAMASSKFNSDLFLFQKNNKHPGCVKLIYIYCYILLLLSLYTATSEHVQHCSLTPPVLNCSDVGTSQRIPMQHLTNTPPCTSQWRAPHKPNLKSKGSKKIHKNTNLCCWEKNQTLLWEFCLEFDMFDFKKFLLWIL